MAKSYRTASELAQLSRLVNAYLDVAEGMAVRKIPMTMQDWETRLPGEGAAKGTPRTAKP